ncbi:hypothetical protein HF324_21465 [Chitinophaga oryzae]|uniref:DUF3108 domain-containing protein n=1 Tax=Chitinophaga oryzae TaxID=2725414 RepID=A0AAE6ZJA2_9BACT|nr:hypothetical protein [Chitinophaga oryzae]QJB33764.1 hypothetical protein HF329_21575 [Chitinophaga oryzae]QJB40288.1 hypothetical protein HF324_21465 [Chitinophaga oryzae]
MKKGWCLILLLLVAGSLSAQDCGGYYYLLNNAQVEMTVFDGSNAPIGKTLYKVSNVRKEATGTASDFTATVFDKSDNMITTSQGSFKCTGDGVAIDMKVGMPSLSQLKDLKMEAKTTNVFLNYPANMQAGQELKGGTFEMAGNMGGMEVGVAYTVNNRKVMGKEKITTPAGSWNCFKISYNLSFKMQMLGNSVPMELTATEWFAPGFGVVKTISYREGKEAGSTMITSFKK